jgi:hypothetical protein
MLPTQQAIHRYPKWIYGATHYESLYQEERSGQEEQREPSLPKLTYTDSINSQQQISLLEGGR